MPSIPPAVLPNNEVTENALAPSRVGIYPPAMEPMVIPNRIINFRDIIVIRIKSAFPSGPVVGGKVKS
jgi:hypothetical protein